jgi:hypothetical protein
MDVGDWLRSLGLERYEEAFRDNEIDVELLPNLTGDDLKDLGVSLVGHRRRLLDALAQLRDARPGNDAAAAERAIEVGATPEPRADHGDPPRLCPEAERRQLTVMFVDLVGSTALAGGLDPEEMHALIGGYQNAVAGEVTRFEGYVAKFMGDGVLAYFGWPRAHEDDAERAVRAGLAITGRLPGWRAEALRSVAGWASPPVWWWSATWSAKGRHRRRRWSGRPPTWRPDCRRWPSPGRSSSPGARAG